ncbi:MAG: DNA/RNA non-specific endonuclease [Gemmatimonadetes bacterium]|nr:DNA/RNA non-specific endonuclease [Gemmatimonadota bacterium]
MWEFGPTKVITRAGYELEHSATDKIPLWVCEHMTKYDVTGSLKRPKPEPFAPDPELPPGSRAEKKDYVGSSYDRGHQAPSADQTRSQVRQNETYYLSNMAPQAPQLNQRIWKNLEEHVRDWAAAKGELFVITGPMFYDPKEDDPSTADGSTPYYLIGPDEVAVPTHFYKILASPPRGSEGWQFLAFVMENRGYSSPFHLEKQLVPVSWIEERTGLRFFPGLPGELAGLKTAKAALWPE